MKSQSEKLEPTRKLFQFYTSIYVCIQAFKSTDAIQVTYITPSSSKILKATYSFTEPIFRYLCTSLVINAHFEHQQSSIDHVAISCSNAKSFVWTVIERRFKYSNTFAVEQLSGAKCSLLILIRLTDQPSNQLVSALLCE